MFEIEKVASHGAKIKVVGVGGSGCNAVNTMIRMGLEGVEFITANTDKQALDASLAPIKLAIGQELTRDLALAPILRSDAKLRSKTTPGFPKFLPEQTWCSSRP